MPPKPVPRLGMARFSWLAGNAQKLKSDPDLRVSEAKSVWFAEVEHRANSSSRSLAPCKDTPRLCCGHDDIFALGLLIFPPTDFGCVNVLRGLRTTSSLLQPSDARCEWSFNGRVRTEELTAMKLSTVKLTDANSLFVSAGVIVLAASMIVGGCKSKTFPDEKDAVTNSLKGNNLSSIDVSQDQDKGVMTLTGNVASDDAKRQAESLTKQAAPDYSIANEIGVRPPEAPNAGSVASNLDSAIEDNFKAAIKGHDNLDDQSIHASAKNGTLVITGSVKTSAQKREAGTLAKSVPNVQQVVNELEVKPDKHSTPNS
jgi:hyperosmotically inducible protein